MFPRTLLVKLFAILLLVQPAALFAQEKRVKRTITVDDYFTQADIFEFAIFGKGVAYTEGRWQKSSDDRKTDLWITSWWRFRKETPDSGRRLTFDRASYRSPQWDDAGWIYCLANRRLENVKKPPLDGKSQVWRIAAKGGD